MKKSLLLLIQFFALTTLFGQVTITPKAGISIAHYKLADFSDEGYDATNQIGLVAGVAIDLPLISGLSIQPEVLYVQKGSKMDSEINAGYWAEIFVPSQGFLVDVYDNYDEKLNYLEMPLLLKYTFLGGSYGFYVTAGVTFSLALNGEFVFTLTDVEGDPRYGPGDPTYNDLAGYVSDPVDIEFGSSSTDFYQKFDLGASVGAGLYVEAGPGELLLDARYVSGLKNIFSEEDSDFSQKNVSIQLTLGYALPLGGGY